jgi:ABC-type lipoprotein release transport system permease subunit
MLAKTVFLKMAAKNIFRQKSRSVVVAVAIILASFVMVVGGSYGAAIQKKMMKDIVTTFLGHLQIHRNTDQNLMELVVGDKTDLDTIRHYDSLLESLRDDERVLYATPRIQIGVLLRYRDRSTGNIMIGVDPEFEFDMSSHLTPVEGRVLMKGENGLLLTRKTKRKLDVDIGDMVTLNYTTPDGAVTEAVLPVRGVVESLGRDFFVAHFCYAHIDTAQKLYNQGKRVTNIVALLKSPQDADGFMQRWRDILGRRDLRVDSYKTLGATYEGISASQVIMVNGATFTIFLLILINIVNIALMTVYERTREIATLSAIGATPPVILSLILTEFLALGMIAATVGIGLGSTLVQWLSQSGIPAFNPTMVGLYGGKRLYPVLQAAQVFSTYIIVTVVCGMAAFYPAYRAVKIEPVKALREG